MINREDLVAEQLLREVVRKAIRKINKENKAMSLAKELKKEVEIGKHGTQKYVVKEGENKGKIV